MKAAVYLGKYDLKVKDVEEPVPGPYEVHVRDKTYRCGH